MFITRVIYCLKNNFFNDRGFGIVEAMVALVLMAIMLLALLGLLTTSVKGLNSSKLSSTANQVANECLERVRGMDYAMVGIRDSEVDGELNAEETITINGIQYNKTYVVSYVDDPADGTGSEGEPDNDYKQVDITISWDEDGVNRSINASTFVKNRPVQTDPPTVNFVFGTGTTPDDQYVIDGESSLVPIEAECTDLNGDLVNLKFYINLVQPSSAFYDFDPTASYQNSPFMWDPNQKNSSDVYVWEDGTYEITAECWDAHGNRDSKSLHWYIDRDPPIWNPAANLTATRSDSSAQIDLAWTSAVDGRDSTVSFYNIYRKLSTDTLYTRVREDYETVIYTYTDTGLASWQTYDYYVKAVSSGKLFESVESNVASAMTKFLVTASTFKHGSDYHATLSWDAPVTVVHYDIYRDGSRIGSKEGPVSSGAVTYTDYSDLSHHHTYNYVVYAYSTEYPIHTEINRSYQVTVTP